jgi:type I restriction enzyme M protein
MLLKWLDKRYNTLWETYKETPFRFDEAAKTLQAGYKDDEKQINVILSEMRKSNLLEVGFDPDDARKRIYTLKSKKDAIIEELPPDRNHLTRSELESLLKAAADLIRTRVDYTFILVLLFYKRISDKWQAEFDNTCEEAINDGLTEEEAREEAQNPTYHDFDIPSGLLWEEIRKEPAHLPENFSKAMKTLAQNNPGFKDIFENADFIQFASSRENAEILRQLVELFSARSLHQVPSDILGDAYEWLLRYFAPQKAKEGEVYTPREVINLLIEMLDPQPGESVYDPACGSGGMLIASYRHIEISKGKSEADRLFIFGQEANHKTLALSRMNLYIHDIRNGHLAYGDTLRYPKFKEATGVSKCDVVIANPPWNQDGYDEDALKQGEFWKARFRYGFTPKQSADWAWIEHMIASAKDDSGRIGVVIDNGCLFRGAKEKGIRASILDSDLIEAVILLPEKLFYNTGAPGAVIILNKNKKDAGKGKVFFINASNDFEQHPDVRKLNRLGDAHIEKMVKAYRNYEEIEGFTKAVSLEEIRGKDYNLNVTLYVYPIEETEEISIMQEWNELKKLDEDIEKVTLKIEAYLKELQEA